MLSVFVKKLLKKWSYVFFFIVLGLVKWSFEGGKFKFLVGKKLFFWGKIIFLLGNIII